MKLTNWRFQFSFASCLMVLSSSAQSVTARPGEGSTLHHERSMLLGESSRARNAVAFVRARFKVALPAPVGLPVPIDATAEQPSILAQGAVRALVDRGNFFEPEFLGHEQGLARVQLGKTADAPFRLTDVRSGRSIRIRLLGARSVSPEIGEGVVVYPGAVQGGSYLHNANPAGTEDFVLFPKPVTEELRYEVELERGIVGLRLVANTLEFLDQTGAPRLRASAPWLIDSSGQVHDAELSVLDCAVDTSRLPAWGRSIARPGKQQCTVRVSWKNAGLSFPILVDPSWSSTGVMSIRRTKHVAQTSASLGVLVAGGINLSNATVLSSAETYCVAGPPHCPAAGTWSMLGSSMATARWGHVAIRSDELSGGGFQNPNGPVKVVGGVTTGNVYLASTENFDPSTGIWTAAPSMATARAYPGIARHVAGGFVVTGGSNSGGVLSSVEAGSWTGNFFPVTPMSSPRVYHTATALFSTVPTYNQNDTPVLVAGGQNASGTIVTAAQRLEGGSWLSSGTMYLGVYSHTATQVLAGARQFDVYVAHGYNSSPKRILQRYNRVSATWTGVATLADARVRHTATLLGDNQTILFAGGVNATIAPLGTLAYNTNSGTGVASSLPTGNGRQNHTATFTGTKVLIAGGHNFNLSTTFDTALLYTP